jgi:hypothetical protein
VGQSRAAQGDARVLFVLQNTKHNDKRYSCYRRRYRSDGMKIADLCCHAKCTDRTTQNHPCQPWLNPATERQTPPTQCLPISDNREEPPRCWNCRSQNYRFEFRRQAHRCAGTCPASRESGTMRDARNFDASSRIKPRCGGCLPSQQDSPFADHHGRLQSCLSAILCSWCG